MNNGILKQRLVRTFIVLSTVAISLLSLYYLSKLIYPFLIALLITILINPVVNFIEKKSTLPRGVSVIITMILGLSLIIFFTTIVVAEIISGSNYLASIMPEHINSFVSYLEGYITHTILPIYDNISSQFNNLDTTYQNTIIQNIKNFGDNAGKTAEVIVENTLKSIPMFLGKIPETATILIFSLMATFFISKDWFKFKSYTHQFLPQNIKEKTYHVNGNLKQALIGFIKAQFILVIITAIIVLIGLLFLGVNQAITIAIIFGIVSVLPYLGLGLTLIPWIIYSFFSGDSHLGIGLSILFLFISILRHVIEPKLLSSSIGLDPLATLISLYVGFKLFGVLGLIIGPVTLVLIKAFYQSGIFKDTWNFIMNGTE